MNFARRTGWNLSTNRIADALELRRRGGSPILDLTISNPTECGFTYDEPSILAAFAHSESLRYSPEPLGLLTAREAVAAYYAERGAQLSSAQLLLTASTSEAYSFLFRLLSNPGDELLIATPSYPLFDFLADIQDVTLVRYPLFYDHSWQIDFHALEGRVTPRTRAIVLVHPNNPTGNYCSLEDAGRLQEICASRGLALIVDEVFLDFALDGEPRQTFAQDSPALTFTLSGISKICGLPQMKFAWLAATGPGPLRSEALAKLEFISDAYLSLSTPTQLAASALLSTRDAFRTQLLARVRANLSLLDSQLAMQSQCSRLDVHGGWNVVLRVPRTRSGEDLAIALLEGPGVHVHPGHFYDFAEEGYLVLSLITPPQLFAQGVEKLLESF